MAPRRPVASDSSMPPPSRPPSPPHDEIEENPFFDSVDELQQHGINVQDILKLKSAAIHTVSGVVMTTRRQLLKIKGMSEAKVEKIKEAAQKTAGSSFGTGIEVQDRRKRVLVLSTGSKSVDAILGGGIMSQSISEVYGEFRTGKTQMAHTMSVIAQLPSELGGAAGKAPNEYQPSRVKLTYIQGTFRPDRIRSIADRFGVDGNMALENILIRSSIQQRASGPFSILRYLLTLTLDLKMDLINECSLRFAEDKDFRLLIVDSIMALFRVDYSGRGELSERQQKLAQMLSKLTKLSEEYNIAVLITNQVQSDPGATMTFVAGGALKPIGGHILSHCSTTRMFLRKVLLFVQVAPKSAWPKLVDSPDRPESEASYKLDEGGWTDV
ncbi:Rad51-domain-containing protein [Melanogaster broomeanus]|nr:Rad51-domain-containing protein [Melanogaster broomeanus]